VFAVMEEDGMLVTVWELVNGSEQVWRRFAHVPSELQVWLVPPSFQAGDVVRVFATFAMSVYSYMHCWLEMMAEAARKREMFCLLSQASTGRRWTSPIKREKCFVYSRKQAVGEGGRLQS
jgi:hypothetical protein